MSNSDIPYPSPRILVVDDEAYVREVLCRCLGDEGYNCETAANAKDALERLKDNEFSLLISDIMMPEVSGIELLKMVRESFPNLAVIMLTAVDDRKTAISTLHLGAYGYLIKPFDVNEVLINVSGALERRRLEMLSRQYEERLEAKVAERTADVRRREEEIAIHLVSASEYRDEETGAHIRRIGLYAAVIAKAVGWPPRAVDDIRVAGPMHDIGKIGIPDSILLKPGKLTDQEFEEVKKHSEIGAAILSNSDVPLLHMARDIALSHHEKWDGAGYPAGLAGEAIPESARIIAVTDVYDALVHNRVYRPAMGEEKALGIMRETREKHFNPGIFDCFLDLLPEFRRIRGEVGD